MKKLIPLILVLVLVATVYMPTEGQSATKSDLDAIDRKIEKLEKEKKAAQEEAIKAKNRIQTIKVEIVETEQTLEEVFAHMEKAQAELEVLDKNIVTKESELADTEQLIVEATERIAARDDLLRSRLRLMYTNGTVSYLDVLLSSTSFSDFLDRYNSLKSLVGKDKEVLEANIHDHELVVEKKGEVEGQLTELAGLYGQQEEKYNNLMVREKEAEVLIASLNREEEHLGEVTEEQEENMIKFAAAIAEQQEKKDEIMANFDASTITNPLPGKYRVSSNYGNRIHPISGKKKLHKGTDFAAPGGTDILAAASGKVITAGWMSGYGNTVIINHGKNDKGQSIWTLYAHGRENGIQVEVGDNVKRGDKISEVGTTGSSTGNHLHFEVRIDQKAVNALDYIVF